VLVSGNEPGRRVPQHTAVVDAAVAAGVGRLGYTSIVRADTTGNPLAPEHAATEALLRASGLPHVVARNDWYLENYTGRFDQYRAAGEVTGLDGAARIGAATRADYAAALVAALLAGRDGVLELAGPPITLRDVAAAAGVPYRDVTADELRASLRAAGLDDGTAGFVVALEESVARGELDVPDDELVALLGRAPVTLAQAAAGAETP
jgi:NAD(P)H dehydrogenase (quinone)